MGVTEIDFGGMKALVFSPTARWGAAGWVSPYATPPDAKLRTPADAYMRVPLIRRAVELRVGAIGAIPVVVTNRRGNVVDWPFGDLRKMLMRAEMDLVIHGAAYWLKLRNRVRVTGVQHMLPTTVYYTVTSIDANGAPEYEFRQRVNGVEYGPWPSDDVVHFWPPNAAADLGPGQSPLATALQDAQLVYYLGRFASRFFEAGAMPVTLLSIQGRVSEKEVKRLEGLFRRLAAGVRNAWRVLATGADVKPQTLTPPLTSLALPELLGQARRAVAHAFGIPQTMLEDAANYATAKSHRQQFWSETVRPEAAFLEAVINEQLAAPLGLQVTLDIDAVDVFQEDEARRAGALRMLVSSGVRPGLAMQMLGMELPEGWEYDPDTGEPRRVRETAKSGGFRADLRRWERKAMKRVKAGKSPAVAFESDNIPPTLAAAITGALEAVKGTAAVRRVFRAAEQRPASFHDWEGYP